MFQKKVIKPVTGGELAAILHRDRDEILSRRRRTIMQRAKQPTVPEFYAGRSVFITGGSGFLGRMLIEQLLRTCPDIDKIYLVLRPKKGEEPQSRLQGLLDVPLFDKLRAERPGALSKLVVLPGDITEVELGLSREHQDLVREKVSVVFHVAASVRFDDPFQKAVFTNLRSTRDVVELARGMTQLKALVHVSTAYTNVNRDPVEETVYPTHLDWRSVIRMAEEMDASSLWAMDCLGPKLRDFHHNSYTFTKALAEKVIDDVADELPVIIVRPSIVINAYKDPLPGWIDNLYGLGAFWAAAWKGLLRVTHSKADVPFNTVPADLVTKNIVLASWARSLNYKISPPTGERAHKGVEVMNASVPGGTKVGVTYQDMQWGLKTLNSTVVFPGLLRDPKYSLELSYPLFLVKHWYHHILFGAVLDTAARLAGKKPRLMKLYRNMVVGMAAMEPFTNVEFNFKVENQNYLQSLMHPKDEDAYCILGFFSVRDNMENFNKWAINTARGVLLYALKEEESPDNCKQVPRLRVAMKFYHGTLAALAFIAIYCTTYI